MKVNTEGVPTVDRLVKTGAFLILCFLMTFFVLLPLVTQWEENIVKERELEDYKKASVLTFPEVINVKDVAIVNQTAEGLHVRANINYLQDLSNVTQFDAPICYDSRNIEIPPHKGKGRYWLKTQEKHYSVRAGEIVSDWYWYGHIPRQAVDCKLCSFLSINLLTNSYGKVILNDSFCTPLHNLRGRAIYELENLAFTSEKLAYYFTQ